MSWRQACAAVGFCVIAALPSRAAEPREQDLSAPVPNPLLPPSLVDDGANTLPARTFGLDLAATVPAHNAETLSAVLAEIWQQHPQVRRALAEVEAAGYDVAGAKAGFYPFLTVEAAQGESNESTAVISVVQPLWAGGRTRALVDEAQAQRLVALAGLNQARLDLALQTAEAYLNVAAGQEQATLGGQYIAALDSLLQVIRRRADNGVSPPVDVETALSRLRQAEASAAANQALLTSNRSSLRSLLNRPIVGVVWPDPGTLLSEQEVMQILESRVDDVHPARQNAESEIEAEEARVRAARGAVWPQLSLQHSRQLQELNGDFTPDSSTQLLLQFQSNNGLQGYRGYQAAQQRVRAARQNLDFTLRDIQNRLRTAQAERATAQAERAAARLQFEAQARSAESAVKLVASFLRQFKVGRKAWVEVLNAQREAHDALLQAGAIKRNFWLANARLSLEGMLWHRLSAEAPPIYVDAETMESWQ